MLYLPLYECGTVWWDLSAVDYEDQKKAGKQWQEHTTFNHVQHTTLLCISGIIAVAAEGGG